MRLFDLLAVLLVLAAAFSYLNHRLLKWPTTIGLMGLSLLASLAILAAGAIFPPVAQQAAAFVRQFDFSQALLHGMLGFLLFAGALHLDVNDLRRRKLTIGLLATGSVIFSTAIVGLLTWGLLSALGLGLPLLDCLLFGALISPTDPIAVLSLLKRIGAPKDLEVIIAGESLFNDGVGVVLFLGLLEASASGLGFEPARLSLLFLREALGGAAFGLVAGLVTYRLLASVDDYAVEILLSLALVAGGYALAEAWHLSGPIAMVVAGLIIGNRGRQLAMSPRTREHLTLFWELIDEFLNAVLFVLIGLEVIAVPFTGRYLPAVLLVIPAVLLARLVSVAVPVGVLGHWRPFDPAAVRILTWGGLRGGISVAMALSLAGQEGGNPNRAPEGILVLTYFVVVFSILVQGLTIGPLTRRWLSPRTPCPKPPRLPVAAAHDR